MDSLVVIGVLLGVGLLYITLSNRAKRAKLRRAHENEEWRVTALKGHRTLSPVRKHQRKRALLREQDWRCNGCDRKCFESELQLDHIVPLAKGGLDVERNLQLLCKSCNTFKGWRYTTDDVRRKHGLRTPRPASRRTGPPRRGARRLQHREWNAWQSPAKRQQRVTHYICELTGCKSRANNAVHLSYLEIGRAHV